MDDFFGMGMMVACLKQVGTSDRCSERLNMEVNTSASWSVHPLRTRPGTPSGLELHQAWMTSEGSPFEALASRQPRSGTECSRLGPRPVSWKEGCWLPQTLRKR